MINKALETTNTGMGHLQSRKPGRKFGQLARTSCHAYRYQLNKAGEAGACTPSY
jgi:hypothetical protein